MANAAAITLHSEGTETASGTGAAVDIGALRTALKLTLNVVGLSGSSADGTNGSVIQFGTGPVVTISGVPVADYDGVIEVEQSGTLGIAQFRWSLDDGATWERESVAVDATVALSDTGLTASFAAGSYVEGTRYEWASVGTAGPGVTIILEDSANGTTGWSEVVRFKRQALDGTQDLSALGFRRFVRARWVLSGLLPSVTFSLLGYAHQSYFTRGELERLAAPPRVLAEVSDSVVSEHIIAASDDVEAAFGSPSADYTLPLTSVPESVKRRGAEIATFMILKAIGFVPTGADELLVKAYDDAKKWLDQVAAGKIEPPGVEDGDPDPPPVPGSNAPSRGARVYTRVSRGWDTDWNS